MFIRGRGEYVATAASATHYKNIEADRYIINHREFCKYRVRSSSSTKKDFVIGQLLYMVGNDNNIVVDISAAKQFCTYEEAENFALSNQELINKLDFPYIYDGFLNKVKEVRKIICEEKSNVNTIYSVVNNENDESIKCSIVNKKESASNDIVRQKRIQISPEKRALIYCKSNRICPICGKQLRCDDYTIDHIKPLSLGGTYDNDNLQAVHHKCNLMKANLNPDEFIMLVNDVAQNNMINNFDYNSMLSMARAMVRGTIASFGGF